MQYENIATSSELPSYSPSIPSPDYTCELACGERLLEQTPRSRSSRSAPTALFIKKAGKTTVVLNDQEEGASIPRYGRQDIISGTVFLEQGETITEVTLKVKGKVDTTISDAGGQSTKTVDDTYTLWSQSSTRPQRSSCPDQIAFSVLLPATYKSGDTDTPLPPSYNVSFYALPSLFIRSSYTLHLSITRIRHRKLEMWTKSKQILIPFEYRPRTCAHRPIVPSSCFFESVKTTPEEWYQAVTPLKAKPNVQLEPIHVHLFIPGARIYGLKDTIPFHVQLSGQIFSLRELFSGVQLDRVTSVDSHSTATSKKPATDKPLFRVYILRQNSVSLKGSKAWKNDIIGEGTLWPVPPDLSACSPWTTRDGHVDWEGELRVPDSLTVGGFDIGNVQVKDFIVLSMTPPTPQSPILSLQITIPIRLVSDSCDLAGLEPIPTADT